MPNAMSLESAQPWWKGAVIYQIYPRSYQDTNGDGVGDLNGITQRLDHVASLGVDGVWISPFFTSPMRDFGYDVADYCDVDPAFGTLEDFDALLSRAHALGLKIIIDRSMHTHPTRTPGSPRAERTEPMLVRIGTFGAIQNRMEHRLITGRLCLADRPGHGMRVGSNITCTISCRASRN